MNYLPGLQGVLISGPTSFQDADQILVNASSQNIFSWLTDGPKIVPQQWCYRPTLFSRCVEMLSLVANLHATSDSTSDSVANPDKFINSTNYLSSELRGPPAKPLLHSPHLPIAHPPSAHLYIRHCRPLAYTPQAPATPVNYSNTSNKPQLVALHPFLMSDGPSTDPLQHQREVGSRLQMVDRRGRGSGENLAERLREPHRRKGAEEEHLLGADSHELPQVQALRCPPPPPRQSQESLGLDPTEDEQAVLPLFLQVEHLDVWGEIGNVLAHDGKHLEIGEPLVLSLGVGDHLLVPLVYNGGLLPLPLLLLFCRLPPSGLHGSTEMSNDEDKNSDRH
ncbi:hypothetical protein BDK51DRAFT_43479 [Blyttiomyces helicus]|uniref:Uncharacterized protein n=1 Tax=Blyttiomyces helicus TaxID=388810 RepID=A0A4P9WGX8_9FUNG|nr:hypothetical protein BDK51DRAFT_43479 [Blyttiomyces helicus]|eukprot:RKO91612.1 hypothetical protein BDK51DRAFT_43479 [Blyttiomyces helicus]